MPSRVILDVSALSRWSGPAVGIVRVEWELARWAAEHIEGAMFVFFDPRNMQYRTLNKKWIRPLIDRTISVNAWIAPNTRTRRRKSDRIPRAIKPIAMWVLQSRR